MGKTYSTGDAAKRLGVPSWKIRRLFERGLLPPPQRAGHLRVIEASDLPKVEEALRQAGYLKQPASDCAVTSA